MATLTNLGLFAAEASLYFVVMAALFRARHRFGIGLFFCALGTMHFLETYLAAILYVELPGNMVISPGSAVLFSGKLVMLLLVYIREDAATVRQPIYGLLIGNFLMVGMVLLLRHHIVLPAVPGRAPDFAFMDEMGWLMVWGTTLLFIDSIIIVLLYERSARWLGNRRTLRLLLCTMTVLTFDQVGFFAALHVFLGLPLQAFVGGWVAKMVAAVFYSVAAGLYLRWGEVSTGSGLYRRRLTDVFDTLTYRERYEALLRETGRDALTGLFDRGRFDRDGATAIAEAIGRRRAVSLLIADIDHFKDINDEHGHAVGDEALRLIATELRDAIREGDRVYRYGGEEFVVICAGLPHRAAIVAAERLRRAVSLVSVQGIDIPLTISIGVATFPEDGANLAALFAVADARLYEAKDAGRNRVVGWKDPAAGGESVVGFPEEPVPYSGVERARAAKPRA
jgi:diguanylate cyclase (GGDEF)-like protein